MSFYRENKARVAFAHRAVRRAIQIGKLVRPEICELCGKRPAPNKRGTTRIEAHHYRGYDDQFLLDVEWLCAPCHHKLRNPPTYPAGRPYVRGENNGAARLTDDNVREMRLLVRQGNGWKTLARKYGVDKMTVKRAVRGETWGWLDDAAPRYGEPSK